MIPELGHFALILAALVSLILGTLPMIGAHTNRQAWIAVARPAATALAMLVTFSFACLTQAFVANDFSVVYVAQHSNSLLPIEYRVAGVWGGHEGSLLLWALILGGWTFAVSIFSRQLPEVMLARVLAVMGMIEASGIGWQGRYEQAELVARFFKAQSEGSPRAEALRQAKAGPPPDLSGGFKYLKLERMAYYVHKDTYRNAVRAASAALA